MRFDSHISHEPTESDQFSWTQLKHERMSNVSICNGTNNSQSGACCCLSTSKCTQSYFEQAPWSVHVLHRLNSKRSESVGNQKRGENSILRAYAFGNHARMLLDYNYSIWRIIPQPWPKVSGTELTGRFSLLMFISRRFRRKTSLPKYFFEEFQSCCSDLYDRIYPRQCQWLLYPIPASKQI